MLLADLKQCIILTIKIIASKSCYFASVTIHILYINIIYSIGWKANAVEFYSLFNQSWHVLAFGNPNIIQVLCGTMLII